MRQHILSCATVAVWLAFAPMAGAQAQQTLQIVDRVAQPAIVATGMGEVSITPNIASINLGVETRDVDSAKASALNAGKMERVLKVIQAFGVAEKDIQTVGYSIYQIQEPVAPNSKTARNVYVVNNSLRVTVRKFSDAGKIIDATTQVGANAIGGIQLDADDETKERAYDRALEKAVAIAMRKANTMARAGNVKLLELLEVSESGPEMPVPLAKGAFVRAEMANTPVQAGELAVRATVSVRYRFAP
jgi:hypothetical protein